MKITWNMHNRNDSGSIRWTKNYVVVSNMLYFQPYLGKIPILTNIFQRGWNHQLDNLLQPGNSSQPTSTAHELMLGPLDVECLDEMNLAVSNQALRRWNIPNLGVCLIAACMASTNEWPSGGFKFGGHDPIPDPSLLMYVKTHILARGTITYGIFWIFITNKIYCKVNASIRGVRHSISILFWRRKHHEHLRAPPQEIRPY